MGAYLAQPVTAKESERGAGGGVEWASGCMQGWRLNMEDAHIANTDLQYGPEPCSRYAVFGVFDGHGGREVALFCRKYLASEVHQTLRCLLKQEEHRDELPDQIAQSLQTSFHKMDEMLRQPEYQSELMSFKNPPKGSSGSEQPERQTNSRLSQMQERVQASVATDMEKAKSRGSLSSEEAMRIALGLSFLKRFSGQDGQCQSEEVDGGEHLAAHTAGATAVCVAITDTHVICANAGDSRAVLCRGGKPIPLSRDHKPNDEPEKRRITAAGAMVKEITSTGVAGRTRTQYRVNGDLNLSRAIGDLRHKSRIDLRPEEQAVCSTPGIRIEPREPEDEFVVLACDGVWDVKSNQQVVNFIRTGLRSGHPLSSIIEELLDACLSTDPKASQGIGGDNMTCIVVKFDGTDFGALGTSGSLCLPFRCLR